MAAQFYLELPSGQLVGERTDDGGAMVFYSGRGGFRLDAEQLVQLVDWADAPVDAPVEAAPAAAAHAPAPDPAASAAAPVVLQGGATAAPAPAQELVTLQLTAEQAIRLQALLNPIAELRPEG